MAILPNFEYDIFISYRHNDNLDGWVTDFVQNLEKELRGTLKETLSIYFDKNPHDGLLETHNVDKSLEGKLKCLIFIPIISQTYCDPKSFAWQHEFCAFNKLASGHFPSPEGEGGQRPDEGFGRDIKLANGNVASRILPIKIHELDDEDKSTIEKEIGGALRAIEFICKEAGVNRPLRANEEHPKDNVNRTFYRDQINKTANAVKELITAIKNPSIEKSPIAYNRQLSPKTEKNRKPIVIGLIILLIASGAYFVYKKISITKQQLPTEKSIAVLPFDDLSANGDQQFLGDGISEEIINVLAQSEGLKVIARSSSFQFKGKNEDLRAIGNMLGVATILEGSVRKYKDQVRVTAQLINVADGSHFWSETYNRTTDNIFEIQDGIAAEVAAALKVTLFEGKTNAPKKPWNEEAQRLYQQGRFFYDRSDEGDMERALELLKKSVAIDSSHGIAIAYLAGALSVTSNNSLNDRYVKMAVAAEPECPEARAVLGAQYYKNFEFDKSFNEISAALELGNSSPLVLRIAEFFCHLTGNTKQGAVFAKRAVEVDPLIARSHLTLLGALESNQEFGELLTAAKRTIELFPQNEDLYFHHLVALTLNGRSKEALSLLKNLKSKTFSLSFIYYRQKNKSSLDSLARTMDFNTLTRTEKAYYYSFFGDKENFFKVLNEEKINVNLLYMMRDYPFVENIAQDPRYSEILSRFQFDKKFSIRFE